MNFLVVGDGAREDALAWRLGQAGEIASLRRTPSRWSARFAGEEEAFVWARAHGAVVVAGPEARLADGIADRARAAGLATVGPTAAASRIETSKAFGRSVAREAGIPTPQGRIYGDAARARAALTDAEFPIVLKADGLAGGKGVAIARDLAEAVRVLAWIHSGPIHLERFEPGDEFSAFVGIPRGGGRHKTGRPVWLGSARDEKRRSAAPDAPMTGGMGAIAPHPRDAEIRALALAWAEAVRRAPGLAFDGVLFLGGAFTARGPVLYEFNARLGDPETQATIFLWTAPSLAATLAGLARGESIDPVPTGARAAAVVLASPGYPDRPEERPYPRVPKGLHVFHGLPKGRVATVVQETGTKVPIHELCALLYQDLGTRDDYYYRDDIGLEREETDPPRGG